MTDVICNKTVIHLQGRDYNTVVSKCANLQITILKKSVQFVDVSSSTHKAEFKLLDDKGEQIGYLIGVV